MSKTEATLFDTRREALIASVGDDRHLYVIGSKGGDVGYGLAKTEHQVLQAFVKEHYTATKLAKDDLQSMMAAELAAMSENPLDNQN